MPSIITHAIVPIAAATALGRQRVPLGLAVAGIIGAMLPDADVIGFKLGIAYADAWGHRGATHSLFLAAAFATAVAWVWRGARKPSSWLFLFAATASHGVLDMLTDGGMGVAVFWPFESGRHFFPLTPIRVSPIGARFFTARGLETVRSELLWVWAPAIVIAAMALWFRRRRLARQVEAGSPGYRYP